MRVGSAYGHKDVKNMTFDPTWKDNLFDRYPDLRLIFAKTEGTEPGLVNRDEYVRWLMWVYDPNSPMVKYANNIKRRKEMALDEVFDNPLEKTTFVEHPIYAIRFLKDFIKSTHWATICTKHETFWEYHKLVNAPIRVNDNDEDDNKKILEAAIKKNTLIESMERYSAGFNTDLKDFFGGDEDLVSAEAERNKFTPETIAKGGKK